MSEADITDRDMNGILVNLIFAISLCAFDVIEAFKSDASMVAASQVDDQKDRDTSDGPAAISIVSHKITASGDVKCTIDDVTAARKSMCPAQCRCVPLDGQEAWTKLTVQCSGYYVK